MSLYSQKDLTDGLELIVMNAADEIKKLRAGRPTPDMFQKIPVMAYGTSTPLEGVASINIESATSVVIKPWDKTILDELLTTLRNAFPDYNPDKDAEKVRINIPPLTEERRLETVKQMGHMVEEHRASVRKLRQKFMQSLEELEGVSEDEVKRDKEDVQKHVDAAIAELDEMEKQKEKDLLPESEK